MPRERPSLTAGPAWFFFFARLWRQQEREGRAFRGGHARLRRKRAYLYMRVLANRLSNHSQDSARAPRTRSAARHATRTAARDGDRGAARVVAAPVVELPRPGSSRRQPDRALSQGPGVLHWEGGRRVSGWASSRCPPPSHRCSATSNELTPPARMSIMPRPMMRSRTLDIPHHALCLAGWLSKAVSIATCYRRLEAAVTIRERTVDKQRAQSRSSPKRTGNRHGAP